VNEWWQSLSIDQQIFAGIAAIGSLALLLQLVLMLIGLDHGDMAVGDADAGSVGDHPSGLAFLSIRTLIAFAVGFGWAGFAMSRGGASLAPAFGVAFVIGSLFMATIFWIMRSMMRLGCSGSLDYRNAVGQSGSVYVTVPGGMAGPGQVEVLVQGRLCTVQAMTKSSAVLAPRSKVKVVDLVDRTTLLVEPLT
jgi:hypothetical protein